MDKVDHTLGNQLSYTWTIYSDNNTVMDLTGVTPTLTIVNNKFEYTALYNKTGTVTDATGGVVEFDVLSTDLVAPGSYYYRIKLTFSGGDIIDTTWGVFNVNK